MFAPKSIIFLFGFIKCLTNVTINFSNSLPSLNESATQVSFLCTIKLKLPTHIFSKHSLSYSILLFTPFLFIIG
jgi:hypothetical protein